MKIGAIIQELELLAHPTLQEEYDNAGLITGNPGVECTGILVSLDATEAVIEEAINKKCNLVVSHHPIVFRGLKKINGKNYVERAIIKAIKQDIALYAIHTNLDNVLQGVNGKIADVLGLTNRKILVPKNKFLLKLSVFVPVEHKEKLLNALFEAGAGQIGNYSECSFQVPGEGTFTAGSAASPYVGEKGSRHLEREVKIEVILPAWLKGRVLAAMKLAHPYEEVAHDLYQLENSLQDTGAGLIGHLPEKMQEVDFLRFVSEKFRLKLIRHTPLLKKEVQKVAVCGGAGSFLTGAALVAGADVYLTGDIKYHEFFDADGRLLLADIGHFESEQYTIDLLTDVLQQKFPNFAVLKTGVLTNPVHYFTA